MSTCEGALPVAAEPAAQCTPCAPSARCSSAPVRPGNVTLSVFGSQGPSPLRRARGSSARIPFHSRSRSSGERAESKDPAASSSKARPSAATAAVCLAAVIFVQDRSAQLADERNLADWQLIVMSANDAQDLDSL